MNTDYWKSLEIQPSFENWKEFYEGCLMCGCDHGCNEWIFENRSKIAILFRILSKPNSNTSLDKMAKMPLKRADHIFYWLMFKETKRFNKKLRELAKKEIE